MSKSSFQQGLHWCCTSCGFLKVGGQPMMECPICEAYKTSFIDIPQHVEVELAATHGADATNVEAARAERLVKVREAGYAKRFRLKGRAVEAVNHPTASRSGV